MTPITREEYFLAKINGDDVPTPLPITREERYLDIIAGNDGAILPPVTREEFYLAKIAGLDISIPEPETRIEKYLAAIAGSDISVPIPITRKEFYLFAWAEEHPETYTGTIVSFIAKKAKPILNLTATLDPIQDLHGYDSPWPPGGRGNKLPPNATDGTETLNGVTIKKEGGVYTLSGTASADTLFDIPLAESVDLSPSTNKICFLNNYGALFRFGFTRNGTRIHYWTLSVGDFIGIDWTDTGNEVVDGIRIEIPINTAISTPIVISPVLMDKTKANTTSFTPFSNECPISGHTGVTVWDDPKYGRTIKWNQMFDDTATATWDGITTEYDSVAKAIKITNNSRTSNYSSGSTRNSVIVQSRLVSGHKYLYRLSPEIPGIVMVRNGNNILPSIFTYDFASSIFPRVTKDYDFVTAHPVGDVTEVQLNFFDLTEMFGEGNEPSTLEEFKALFPHDYYDPSEPTETCVSAVNGDPYNTYPITFPDGQTVYSGTLGVNEDGSGEIVVDQQNFDGGSLTWTKNTGSNFRNFTAPPSVKIKYNSTISTVKSSMYKRTSNDGASSTDDCYVWVRSLNPNNLIAVKDTAKAVMTAEEFKTAMTGVDFVCVLDAPITIQLTAEQVGQITTLKGTNVVWVDDSDEISVTV